ncbi:MAG: hypothetical protein WB799_08900 [Candidatus Sulfotelmatobacter sp.]
MMGIAWPENKAFAFSIFDDTDSQTLQSGKPVYSLLAEYGFRTTKSVWPILGRETSPDHGMTCQSPDYLAWAQGLQSQGFEIGYHMATSHTSERSDTLRALDQFAQYFGHDPVTMANHYFCEENIYFGDRRVSGANRLIYNLLTGFRNRGRSRGHMVNDPLFWGDLCRSRLKYVRNFTFAEINTLKACPFMPYHDPERPYVNLWFASSEGKEVRAFNQRLSEAQQDQLESEGGACIMYTHFGLGFCDDGLVDARFQSLMQRLSRRNGWFVPVSTLLDYILSVRGPSVISPENRRKLERKWLLHKVRHRTT